MSSGRGRRPMALTSTTAAKSTGPASQSPAVPERERPTHGGLSGDDGRGGFRTCDLSRVKREGRAPSGAGRSRP
jgi:hypothetical protein